MWEDVGMCKSNFEIYVLIGFDILGIHCRHRSKCHYSEHVRTNTCGAYDPVCCFVAVARMGLGGPNLARTLKFTLIFTRAVVQCMILFCHAVSLHSPAQTRCAFESNI